MKDKLKDKLKAKASYRLLCSFFILILISLLPVQLPKIKINGMIFLWLFSLVLGLLVLYSFPLSFASYWQKSKKLIFFVFVMVATLTLNLIYEGHDLVFVFTFFLLFLLKVSLSLAVLISLVGQLPFYQVMRALFDLKLSPLLIFIIMLMYRYIEVLQEEWGRMDLARKMREGQLRHSYAKYRQIPLYAKMIGVLFIRTIDRAERVSIAMKSRGWSGEFDRQQLDKYLRQLRY